MPSIELEVEDDWLDKLLIDRLRLECRAISIQLEEMTECDAAWSVLCTKRASLNNVISLLKDEW